MLTMRMTSLNVMWAATAHEVYRSTDAGRHWSDVSPRGLPANRYATFFALDDQAAWFAYFSYGEPRPSTVFRTVNGGASWVMSANAIPTAVPGITFVDRLHGWITASGGAAAGSEAVSVYRSVDGGATWSLAAKSAAPDSTQPAPSGLEFGCDKGAATFGNTIVGLLPAICAGGAPFIYRSVDGGAHWKSVALPAPAGVQQTGGFFANPVFITSTDVVMGGDYYSSAPVPFMLVTGDAGASWRGYRLPGQGSIDFESMSSGWILTDPIRATTDGGATWHVLSIPVPPFKPADMTLQFLGRGIAVAWSFQQAFRTDDGGRTWRSIPPARPLI
jgi:photosystem II stability/assembly factor-like uncharacterized protein